jgi:hypothetical protein
MREIVEIDKREGGILLTLRHCHLTYAYNNMAPALRLIARRHCEDLSFHESLEI